MPEQSHLQGSEWAIEHTEDCPADRGDCVCGGYVPLSVAEKLATALERIGYPSSFTASRSVAAGHAREALREFRAAYPREETTG